MKTKIVLTILPTIIGILAVLAVLFIISFFIQNRYVIESNDKKFFALFVPGITSCALIVQYLLTLPIWKKFKIKGNVLGMNLLQFTCLISLIGGLIFGFIFWERSLGNDELVWCTLTGFGAFAIYWTSNLIILKRLDRE